MWASNQQSTQTADNDNEIMCYLRCPDEPKSVDPLLWWRDHKSSYPILSKLAQKYLSIPSTSVPSSPTLATIFRLKEHDWPLI